MNISELKIAVSFVYAVPYTTGIHILNAVKKICKNTEYFQPKEVPQGYDIYIHVDSGHTESIHSSPERTIFYSIDSYQNHPQFNLCTRLDWWEYIIKNVYMFVDAFEYGYEWIKTKHPRVHYISMGYNKDIYYYNPLPKDYDVFFCGGKNEKRQEILSLVAKKYNLYSPSVNGDQLRTGACMSKCFLDIPPIESNMLGQRFYEGYACFVPMVSMDRPCIQPYKDHGISLYDINNLRDTLYPAIEQAINFKTPVERDLTGMSWEEKMYFTINKYIEYKQNE